MRILGLYVGDLPMNRQIRWQMRPYVFVLLKVVIMNFTLDVVKKKSIYIGLLSMELEVMIFSTDDQS